ncbi:MAG: hypothetical protein GF317_13645 [Candidatus Lokiarchaeota archaeon]|nr:hypothetical protein [Candidatus Lokiarchaeota archaeon]
MCEKNCHYIEDISKYSLNKKFPFYLFCPWRWCVGDFALCLLHKEECKDEECPYKEMMKRRHGK